MNSRGLLNGKLEATRSLNNIFNLREIMARSCAKGDDAVDKREK